MGDCRIRIQISASIINPTTAAAASSAAAALAAADVDSTPCTKIVPSDKLNAYQGMDLITIGTNVYSADTTTEEVFERTTVDYITAKSTMTVGSLINSDIVTVWDCTSHPSINVTHLCRQGTTKTLYSMGWYPSGYIQILPLHTTNAISISSELYDDVQYNRTNNSINNTSHTGNVQLLPQKSVIGNGAAGSKTLPSQILHSVTQRFNDEATAIAPEEALRIRQENNRKKVEANQLRNQKLDAYIQRLETNPKKNTNQGVSDQVRKMLIKSRATELRNADHKKIEMQDRVYLHCVLWYDMDGNVNTATVSTSSKDESYIYVSIQDTVGRVLDSFVPSQSHLSQLPMDYAKEILLLLRTTSCDQPKSNVYRQLSRTLRFYEAIEKQLISKDIINTVIIRFFNPNEQDSMMSFENVATSTTTDVASIGGAVSTDTLVVPQTETKGVIDSKIVDAEMHGRITRQPESTVLSFPIVTGGIYNLASTYVNFAAYVDSGKISTKEKVRQMQMKSKARGDVKCIPQMEHRLFLQLISAVYNRTTNTIQVNGNAPVFVSRFDNIQQLVNDQPLPDLSPPNDGSTTTSWELLIPILSDMEGTTNTEDNDVSSSNGHEFRLVASSMNQCETKLTWDDMLHHEIVQCFGHVLLLHQLSVEHF